MKKRKLYINPEVRCNKAVTVLRLNRPKPKTIYTYIKNKKTLNGIVRAVLDTGRRRVTTLDCSPFLPLGVRVPRDAEQFSVNLGFGCPI